MLLDEELIAFGVERGGQFVAERLKEALVLAVDGRDGFEAADRQEIVDFSLEICLNCKYRLYLYKLCSFVHSYQMLFVFVSIQIDYAIVPKYIRYLHPNEQESVAVLRFPRKWRLTVVPHLHDL